MMERHPSVVVRTGVRLLVPLAQIYALYVVFHGHYSPGGGFQGGVVVAASYILVSLALGREVLVAWVGERALVILSGVGVALYAGVGALSLLGGARYLDYAALSFLAGDVAQRRSLGILLVELGVTITVAAGLLLIYLRLTDTDPP